MMMMPPRLKKILFWEKDGFGPGMPRGVVMEIRAILFFSLLLVAIFSFWLWSGHEEKQVYLQTSFERTETAAGRP